MQYFSTLGEPTILCSQVQCVPKKTDKTFFPACQIVLVLLKELKGVLGGDILLSEEFSSTFFFQSSLFPPVWISSSCCRSPVVGLLRREAGHAPSSTEVELPHVVVKTEQKEKKSTVVDVEK